jgi:hypothetical protein
MKWLALAIALLTSSVAGAMDCQLAKDIEDAAEARAIYLEGVREMLGPNSNIEKMTLEAEINALIDLKQTATNWILLNCGSDDDSP